MPPTLPTVTPDELRTIPKLAALSDEALAPLIAVGTLCEYQDGEHLFRAGKPAAALYFVLQGAVRIRRRLDDGDMVELAHLEAGSILGEVALLARGDRSTDGSADGLVRAFRAPREALFRHYRDGEAYSLQLLYGVAELLAHRLEAMNRRLSTLISAKPKGADLESFKRKILDDWPV